MVISVVVTSCCYGVYIVQFIASYSKYEVTFWDTHAKQAYASFKNY